MIGLTFISRTRNDANRASGGLGQRSGLIAVTALLMAAVLSPPASATAQPLASGARQEKTPAAQAAPSSAHRAPGKRGQNVTAAMATKGVRNLYGAFHHKGDWLQMIDTCRDGKTGTLEVRYRSSKPIAYYDLWNYPGHCGQRWINTNFQEKEYVGIRLCRPSGGARTCTPWRWGIA